MLNEIKQQTQLYRYKQRLLSNENHFPKYRYSCEIYSIDSTFELTIV